MALVSLTLLTALSTTAASAGQNTREIADRQSEAFAVGGLRAAAKVTGSYIGTASAGEAGSPTSLKALARSSDAIVIGSVNSNRSLITRDGFSILMHYVVGVERALQGGIAGRQITVIIPGGRVEFEDGSWAQLNTPDFVRPVNGRRYVWFLRTASAQYGRETTTPSRDAFAPSFGPLGVYDITDETVYVRPNGGVQRDLATKIGKIKFAPAAFLAYLEEVVVR